MAAHFGKSEGRIRVIILEAGFPPVKECGQYYGVEGKANGSGRSPNLYDKAEVITYLTRKFSGAKKSTVDSNLKLTQLFLRRLA